MARVFSDLPGFIGAGRCRRGADIGLMMDPSMGLR
jgi:hypothetical protein